MNAHPNIPAAQHRVQSLVDKFNADERVWERLQPRRLTRRKLLRGASKKKLRELDLREYAKARPPEDCIGNMV
jgi:hypothetical protein